jgi:hypothetical protein
VIEGVDTISLSARGAFHRPRVERLLATFTTLLADIVAHPDVAVSRLDLGDGLTGDSPATLDFRGFGIDLERIEVTLRRCPGVREVWVSVSHEAPDEPHLVAHVVAAATDGPTLRQLQLAVWEELPGYAWPAAMVVESASPDDSAVTTWDALGPKTPEVSCLASLWAEVAGPGTPASPWATSRSRGTGPSPPGRRSGHPAPPGLSTGTPSLRCCKHCGYYAAGSW